jgi:hypothetical protein
LGHFLRRMPVSCHDLDVQHIHLLLVLCRRYHVFDVASCKWPYRDISRRERSNALARIELDGIVQTIRFFHEDDSYYRHGVYDDLDHYGMELFRQTFYTTHRPVLILYIHVGLSDYTDSSRRIIVCHFISIL